MPSRTLQIAFLLAGSAAAQTQLTPGVKPFIGVDAPVIALEHVRVIDGTGAQPLEDQTIVIDRGRIQSVASSNGANVPANAKRMDLANQTVIPGLVGMHEHLFYPSGGGVPIYIASAITF